MRGCRFIPWHVSSAGISSTTWNGWRRRMNVDATQGIAALPGRRMNKRDDSGVCASPPCSGCACLGIEARGAAAGLQLCIWELTQWYHPLDALLLLSLMLQGTGISQYKSLTSSTTKKIAGRTCSIPYIPDAKMVSAREGCLMVQGLIHLSNDSIHYLVLAVDITGSTLMVWR